MIINYKAKYQETKAHEEILLKEIAKLKEERAELRWQNENLWIEIRRLNKIKDKLFEAGCIIAKELLDLKNAQKGQEK